MEKLWQNHFNVCIGTELINLNSKLKVLITGCGGYFMIDTMKCIKNNEFIDNLYLIGASSKLDDNIEPFLDEYIEVPVSTDKNYIDILLQICKEKQVDILIPTVDEELYPLFLRKKEFKDNGIKVSVYNSSFYTHNKINFLYALKQNNIPYPDYQVISSANELLHSAEYFHYPKKSFVVKLPNKSGSRGFRKISIEGDDFVKYENEKPSMRSMSYFSFLRVLHNAEKKCIPYEIITQEYLSGNEYSIDLLAKNGKVLYMVGRENTEINNSIPNRAIVKRNKEAFRLAEEITDKLKLSGNIGFDFILNKEGFPIPIEVNARITATISLCCKAGINLPVLEIMNLSGMELPKNIEAKEGTTMVRRITTEFSR